MTDKELDKIKRSIVFTTLCRSMMWERMRSCGEYDFQLLTPQIEDARAQFKLYYRGYCRGQITLKLVKEHFTNYCELVRRETIRDFKYRMDKRREEMLRTGALAEQNRFIPPCDTVTWDWVEVLYINQQYQVWEAEEGTNKSKYEFNNHFPPQDYSHIPIGKHIETLDYILEWGKRYRGLSIREILRKDADYLMWMINNTTHFTFSDTVKLAIKTKSEEEKLWD